MESILRDGAFYDLLHKELTVDIDFYVDQARKIGGPVLELCCGTGRIAIPTAKAGIDITGLDLSGTMLAEAHKKKPEIEWIKSDATNFDLGRKFRLITTPFNSIQLFSKDQIHSFFECTHAHLENKGFLIFDVFNPNVKYLAADSVRYKNKPITDPQTGEEIQWEHTTHYDDASQINHVTFYYSKSGKPDFFTENLEQRCFFPQEIDMIVESHRFKIIEKYGDFTGKIFASGDPKQILVCAKN